MPKPVVVFDLDHTLIHAEDCRRPGFFSIPIVVGGHRFFIHFRPGALALVRHLCEQTKVRFGFWTAGTSDYAQAVVRVLFRAANVKQWYRHVCTLRSRSSAVPLRDGRYVKCLSRVCDGLDVPSHLVWLVDDDVTHALAPCNQGRIIQAPPFFARPRFRSDTFLASLCGMLPLLSAGCLHRTM